MNKKIPSNKYLIMVGPHVENHGGISTVLKTWCDAGVLKDKHIKYIPTTSPKAIFKSISFIRAIFRFILNCSNNCFGVYIHTASHNSFYRKAFFILIGKIFDKPIILHIHSSYFYQFINKSKKLKRNVIFFILARVSVVIVLTHEMQSEMSSILAGKKIYVIRNGIDFKKIKNKFNFIRKQNFILYLGRYTKEKGIYDLIDAIKIVINKGYDLTLNLYGENEKQKIVNYVKKMKLESKILINDWIDGKKKISVFYQSSFIVLPSYTEGIPNVIIEAMATQTPIISTEVGGLKEILVDGENAIIIQAGNPRDLSDKIIDLLNNEKLRETISKNAYEYAKREFNIEIIRDQLYKILNRF